MKQFLASIDIMPHKELLDPQGKTVARNMDHMDLHGISDVRVGKHIEVKFEAADEKSADKLIHDACQKLLTNVITETYTFQITSA
ncbi:MAG TPA: phosphoribosylformylglycinamidine synthase subunit PurS [Saprospiraceae bacterium]|nr:phosphoribosylformylglycinamidine synthase subunit PurS [Saprospiraceae bacterium]